MFKLLLPNPPHGAPASFKIKGPSVRIGREQDNDLVLDHTTISRHHAVLHREPDGWWIEDLQSGNGIRLNKQRIGKAWLKAGDRLTLGQVEIFFQADEPLSPAVPIPQLAVTPIPPPLPSAAAAPLAQTVPPMPPPIPQPFIPPLPAPAYPQIQEPERHRSVWGWWVGGGAAALLLLTLGSWFAWSQASGSSGAGPATAIIQTDAGPSAVPLPLPKILRASGEWEEHPGATPLREPPRPLPDGAQALFTCRLGDKPNERLDEAVVLEFPYNPSRLPAGIDPENQMALAYLDERAGVWVLAAAKVDPEKRVIRTRTRHLSTWSGIYLTKGWRIARSRRFSVVYEPTDVVVFEDVRGAGGIIPAQDFAETLGQSLDISLKRYETAGFKMPEGDSEEDGRIWAFLGRASSYWSSPVIEAQWSVYSGNLLFPTNFQNSRQADHDAAHELFHKIQNLDLNIASMDIRRWWIEASADYAAAKIALQQGGIDTTMGNSIKSKYLDKSITYYISNDNGKQLHSFHDYSTSHFIDYLVKQGADFKDMWKAVANPSLGDLFDVLDPLDKYLKGKFGLSKGLDSFYRDFAPFFLFDARSPMPRLVNGFFADVAVEKLSLAPGQKNGRMEAGVEALHSAKVFAVRAEAETDKPVRKVQVGLVPGTGSGIIASAYLVKNPGKGGLLKPVFLSMMGLKPATAELAPGELIVVVACNSTSSNRSIGLEVKDLSLDARRPDPPPAPTSRGARIEICVYAQCSYSSGYRKDGFERSPRRWEGFELAYNSGGIPIASTGTLRGSRNDGRYQDTVEGSADSGSVRELKWTAVRRYTGWEEKWEIELKGIPREPELNQLSANGTTYMIRIVDENGKKFNGVNLHATIVKHEIHYLNDNTKIQLEDVSWYGVAIGNPNPAFSASPSNQRPFILVQIWK